MTTGRERGSSAGAATPGDGVVLSGLAGPEGSSVGRWLAGADQLLGRNRPLVGPLPRFVAAVDAAADVLAGAEAGLPDTAAGAAAAAEAVAVRLRRRGVRLSWTGTPRTVQDRRALEAAAAEWGRGSVEVLRADPSLLPELRLGTFVLGGWRIALARRVALAVPAVRGALPPPLAFDAAFWAGVREAATPTEWRRLTGSSYVVLCYHRLLGEAKPGEERMDVRPRQLRRQLRLLGLLGYRPLDAAELAAFHTDPAATLPRRRYLLTADDAYLEAVRELTRVGRFRPHVFAVTDFVGGLSVWLGDAPVASWADLRDLRTRGGTVGSHAREHVPLDTLAGAALDEQLTGSRAAIADRLGQEPIALAYPHGRHSLQVVEAARRAGYALAFTTQQGRNGAGTDRWCLRRVEPKIWDSLPSFLWKVVTGHAPPGRWERRLERRWQRSRR